MAVRVLVAWDKEEDIPQASRLFRQIDDFLDILGVRAGSSTVNQPRQTFGIDCKTLPAGQEEEK